MARHKEIVFCAHRPCGERLRPTVLLTARIESPLRADWSESYEYAHTVHRTRRGYRPDVIYVAARKVKLRWNARCTRRAFQPV